MIYSNRFAAIFPMVSWVRVCFQQLQKLSVTDEQVLEDAAAEKLKIDKDTVKQLRGGLKEERQTFAFLGWIGAAFLGAAALLWAIWPSWLKIGPPSAEFRWVVVILLLLAAVFAGSWTSRHYK